MSSVLGPAEAAAPSRTRVFGGVFLAVVASACWAACRGSCGEDAGRAASRAATASSRTAAKPRSPLAAAATHQLPSTVTLLELGKTAYHTRIDLTADAIYLLTMEGAFRLAPGEEPRETRLDLSDTGVATPSAFVFWSNGSFWLAPKRGGPPGRLASVKDRPIYIVAVEERFAWIGPGEQGHHTVYTLRQGKPHAIHEMSGPVAAATMVDDRVVFLERPENNSWRLGSIGRSGGSASFTPTRVGRYPGMLVAAGDVYYYYFDDKDTSEVWAVSPDLRNERVVARNVICSPLAVADRVFCGGMEGVFEISPTTGLSKLVYPSIGGSITAIAVDQKRIVWVSDVGQEKLEVKLLLRDALPPG